MKGQVAIEYLTTYGWAVLLLVIVIGVIVTMFSPSALIAEQCNIDKSNLPCNAQIYNDGGEMVLKIAIANGFGYPIKLVSIEIDDGKGNIGNVEPLPLDMIEMGEETIVTIRFNDGERAVNSLINMNMILNYQSCAQEINQDCTDPTIGLHQKSGKIVGRILD